MATFVTATNLRNILLNAIGGRIALNGTNGIAELNGYAYLALSSTAPSYTATGDITGITEPPTAQGYERKLIGHSTEASTLLMGSATNGQMTNAEEIHFNQAKEAADGGTGWGAELKYFAIYNAKTGGSPILAGELTTAITVAAGYVVIIKEGQLVLKMNPV